MSGGYFINAEGVDYYGRPNRLPLAVSHGPRENGRAYPIGQYGNRNSPLHESDSDKGGNQPRRRIAVACSRCRKRKIKCSGDPGTNGNGQGCQNCKSAGIDPGQCQFLRVGSNSYPLADASWPYSASGQKSPPLGMGQAGGSLGQYSSNIPGSQPSMAPSSWPGSIQLSRAQSSNGSANLPWVAAPARQVYRSNFGVNYSDDYIEAYNMQSPQYLLPSQDSQVSGVNYGTQDLSRNWTPMATTSRISQNGSFLDQDGHSRYGASTFPYLNSPTSAVTADASSLSFPAMASLATSLPVPSSNADRVLPTPTPKNVAVNSINNGLQMLGDTNSYASQGSSYKASVPWGPESVTTGGTQNSTATAVSVDTSSVVGASRHKSSSPPPSSQETSFGYIPISHSPPAISAITASDYSSNPLPTATRGIEGYGSSAHPALNGLSGDTLMPSHNSSTNLYSYTVGSSTRRGSNADTATSDGTLVSGQPYTRLRQPQPHQTTSFDTIRRDSVERSSRIAHRTSISSIDNNRHY